MMVVPGVVVLLVYLYWRLHQVFEVLRPLTVWVAVSLVLFGLILDMRSSATRPRGSSLLAALFALVMWCLITVAIGAPQRFGENLATFGVMLIVYVVLSEGLQSFRAIGVAAGVLLSITVGLSALGVHQGLAPTVCYMRGSGPVYDAGNEIADDRPCITREQCVEGGAPDAEYNCEHVGLLGTHSIGGRVRYRGILEDPNELSWAITMGLPLAFALYERRRSSARLMAVIVAVVLGGICMVMTQSRSGQLGMLATLGVYFVKRFRGKGVLAAVAVGIPLMLLGGRSGSGAESSTEERLAAWSEALAMWRENPFFGVGAGQFTEHYYLTAHNSFLLALSELGPVGLFLWSFALYLAFKVTIRAQIDLANRPESETARTWATALLATLVGMTTSAMFLTLTYHAVLWVYLGLVGALYAAIRAHDPNFRVRISVIDIVFVGVTDFVLVSAIAIYVRMKGM